MVWEGASRVDDDAEALAHSLEAEVGVGIRAGSGCDRDATIVTYCSNVACSNSELAAAQLGRLGYGGVRRYVEGKEDWQEAGYALETGA
jgi:rhodanese-related sulfurtransferase